MKPLIFSALLLSPLAAHASYGPVETQADMAGAHLVDFAWITISDPKGPGCTDPTPHPELFACVVGPAK